MTNEQLAAYLEMLAGNLSGIRKRLIQNLESYPLDLHPEKDEVYAPFGETNPRANQPLCLDELTDFIVDMRDAVRKLTDKRNVNPMNIRPAYRTPWTEE